MGGRKRGQTLMSLFPKQLRVSPITVLSASNSRISFIIAQVSPPISWQRS